MWEHIPIDMIRASVDERTYFISDDWTALNQSPEKTNLRILPAYDKDNRTGSFILYYKEPHLKGRKELGVYPKPSYYGGITAIQTDVDISKFHMYELQNGFKSGTLINFPSGYPETTEELNRLKENVKGRSQSVEDAGEIILTFSNGKDESPEVLSLNGNNLDQRYLATEKSVQQNILVAHAITSPQLFGVRQEGSFNSAESMDLFNIFKATYVNTKQKRLEWMLNLMLKLGGYIGEVKLVDVEPFPKRQPTPAPTPIVQSCDKHTFSDDEIKVFEQFGESNEDYIVLGNIPIEWNTPDEEVKKRHQQLFETIGTITGTTPGGK
jgi:predicted small secreted protein